MHHPDTAALGELSAFRDQFHACLSRRADALFEVTDAVVCCDGPVRSLVETSLAGEHRRGRGSLYAALNQGRIDIAGVRRALTSLPLPRAADGRVVLAVDITCWRRPEAHTSPERVLCHTYGRGKDTHIMVPGWSYSIVGTFHTGSVPGKAAPAATPRHPERPVRPPGWPDRSARAR
ncbi:MAG TPA: transposase [Pseudonocardiaceae bacterium]|nr:transposase [Pseudonocardiaceae bacterium]